MYILFSICTKNLKFEITKITNIIHYKSVHFEVTYYGENLMYFNVRH